LAKTPKSASLEPVALRARLLARAHKNVVVVALANKLARIAWVVLARGGIYNTGYEAVAAECKDCPGPRFASQLRNHPGQGFSIK
jgi:hypothetical protein